MNYFIFPITVTLSKNFGHVYCFLTQINFFLQVFEVCDEDNKGYLSREKFEVALVLLFSYKPSKVYMYTFYFYILKIRSM